MKVSLLTASASACAALLAVASCAPESTAPVAAASQASAANADAALQQAMAADRQFSDEAQTLGMAEAFAKWMDAVDGKMISPGEVAKGADAIRAAFSSWPDDLNMTWAPDMGHAAASGDMAVTSGRWVRTRNDETVAEGRYVTVWRRNADGQWRGLIDIGAPDPAKPVNTPPDPEGRPG